jgi:phosphogluconate dehydratase
VRDGDIIRLDSYAGILEVRVSQEVLASRSAPAPDLSGNRYGIGRELFGAFRKVASDAEEGAIVAG